MAKKRPSKKPKLSKLARSKIRQEQENNNPALKPTWARNKFQCFSCFDKDLSLLDFEMLKHEDLKVAICDSCAKQHINEDNDEWHDMKYWNEFDTNGKCLYCTICGEGGTLMACDKKKCKKSYCLECLKRWMGEEELNEFLDNEDKEFCCFICFEERKEQNNIEDDSIYKNFLKFQKATKSYFRQKDRIDFEDLDIKLEEGLKASGKTKQFTCYSCFSTCHMTKSTIPDHHPKLEVVMCQDCLDYLDFNGNHDNLDFCYLTGQGGELVACDNKNCRKAFSTEIFEKWLGPKQANELLEDEEKEFICFFCDHDCGRTNKFLEQSVKVKQAFNMPVNDEEFIAPKPKIRNGVTSKRKLSNHGTRTSSRSRKMVKMNGSLSSNGRRSSRNRRNIAEESSDEEIEIERRITRDRQPNTNSYLEEASDASTDEEDITNNNSTNKTKDPATEQEASEYFEKYLKRASKRMQQTDLFQELMQRV